MASITVYKVGKSFGETPVLRDVSLEVADGEFVTLLGPSGCGKSTLLRLIAGLDLPDTGLLKVGDHDVTALPPRERDVAMVFQSYALYPHLTVRDNMAVPLRMRRLSAAQRLPVVGRFLPGAREALSGIDRDIRRTAEALGLEPLLGRKPSQLSGGQRQRVAVGRAMVREPKAFLMDEPLSNLDAKLRVQLRTELSQLHRSLGATFVYVTHDQVEAMTMSDRVAVMLGGRILQVGGPDHIYHQPNCIEVAEFVGSPRINVVDALYEAGRVKYAGGSLAVEVQAIGPLPVRLGFRPEAAVLDGLQAAHFRGEVVHLENLGSDLLVHVRPAGVGGTLVIRTTPDRRPARLGAEVGLSLCGPIHVFDATGQRVDARLPRSVNAGIPLRTAMHG